MLYDIDFADETFHGNIEKSAQQRWPACELRRIRRPGRGGHYVFSIGAFKDGKLIAYAKVNRRGAVYWYQPWPTETWEVEIE
ncbi:hypothetical protein [Thermogutta sp.]|jgi:hypothetical protein|uniref:hypothetical protein n=1 Tax=Thermogutta sp. TaxID=1962930 RepID=UPI003220790D